MAPDFIFYQDIEEIVRQGKKTIEVGEEVRLSAAALDLIREHQIEIVYKRLSEAPSDKNQSSDGPGKQEVTSQRPEKEGESLAASPGQTAGPSADTAMAEEEVERIVNLVIERFKKLKGLEGLPKQEGKVSPSADDDDLVICRCEEITKGEIKEAIRNGLKTVSGIKRITRAGMGLCQGQTCERLVTQILARELGLTSAAMEPMTARARSRARAFSS